MIDLSFDAWPAIEGDWHETGKGHRPDDQLDFHVDLGCGRVKKARIGLDARPAEGVNILCDLNEMKTYALPPEPGAQCWERLGHSRLRLFSGQPRDHADDYFPGAERRQISAYNGRLPFGDSSVKSMISHHALEHIGTGFIHLMDECYRVLKPGAPFRIIVPLFPSTTAVSDPDHCRYFMDKTFEAFCGFPDNHWHESFSVPYTNARFEMTDHDMSPPTEPKKQWTDEDRRELRVTLRPRK